MKKLLSFVCFLLCVSLLFSCGKKQDPNEYDHAADFTEEDGELYATVPTDRFGGATFRILNAKTGAISSKLDSESVNGDNLNEALFRRNSNVEERLDVNVEEERDTPENISDKARSACLAGDTSYSAVCNSSDRMATLAVSGYLVSSEYLTGVNLSKPWWNAEAINATVVGTDKYFFYGDLQLSYYDAHSMVGVNMDMVEDINGISDPYELAKEGKWTLDEMLKMMRAAAYDVDGNGKLNTDDRYGAAVDSSSVLSLVIGCDTAMFSKNDVGMPQMDCLGNDKFYDVFTFISESFFQRQEYIYNVDLHQDEKISAGDMFAEGKSMFYITTVGSLYSLQSMEYEFGVLPMPKYTEYQKEYVSYLNPEKATAIGVISTGRNYLRTGIVLENLAAESHRESGLRDCYVDTVLSFRYVDDAKSRESLATVLETGTFDLGDIYGWGNIAQSVRSLAGDDDTFVSTISASELKTLSDIRETFQNLESIRYE